MTEFETATIALQAAGVAIGLGQIAIVWHGIRVMIHAGAQRAREQDQRHAESMAALDAQTQALRGQSDALAELIRRTGGAQ